MVLSNTDVPKYYGMFRDAVIRGEIPYYQTSNASGGVTSYIAKEGDSK